MKDIDTAIQLYFLGELSWQEEEQLRADLELMGYDVMDFAKLREANDDANNAQKLAAIVLSIIIPAGIVLFLYTIWLVMQ